MNCRGIALADPTGRAYSGQHFYQNHPAFFTNRAGARVCTGEPLNALQFGFGRLLFFYNIIDAWFFFGHKLQIKISPGGVVVNSEPPDFNKAPWKNV